MGTWGYGAFEQDDALDWLLELVEVPKRSAVAMVRRALKKMARPKPDVYYELQDCCPAVAAAELVAAAFGFPGTDLHPDAVEWLEGKPLGAEAELVELALQAVATVRTRGESYDLWVDAGEEPLRQWQTRMDDLSERLRKAQATLA